MHGIARRWLSNDTVSNGRERLSYAGDEHGPEEQGQRPAATSTATPGISMAGKSKGNDRNDKFRKGSDVQ